MPRPDRRLARLAVIGALAAALGVSACGRKGPLDAPPSSYAPPPGQPAAAQPQGEPAPDVARPIAPRGSFPLDFLLN